MPMIRASEKETGRSRCSYITEKQLTTQLHNYTDACSCSSTAQEPVGKKKELADSTSYNVRASRLTHTSSEDTRFGFTAFKPLRLLSFSPRRDGNANTGRRIRYLMVSWYYTVTLLIVRFTTGTRQVILQGQILGLKPLASDASEPP